MIGKIARRIPEDKRGGVIAALGLPMIIAGCGALLGFLHFFETTVEKCEGHLWNKECTDVPVPLGERVASLMAGIGLSALLVTAAIFCLALMMSQSHLKKYQAILTGVEVMSVQKIANITHVRPARVRSEIQSLIDSDEIDDFYIDYGADNVVSRKYIPKTSHKTVVKCTECGGNNEVIVGITRHCSFCGQPLLLGQV